jgi:hypothetical protein
MVGEENVREALRLFGREHELRAFDGHVIGGKRYVRTIEAARARGWDDMAVFIEAVEKLSESASWEI